MSEPATAPPSAVVAIGVDRLHPDPNNVRRTVGDVTELARSIAGVGVIEPCVVTPLDGAEGSYRIVAGHRRHAAALVAEVTELPCLVRCLTEPEIIEIQLAENLSRSAIGPIDEAAAYFRLGEHGVGARALAQRLGKSERHIRSRLALLELPEAAQSAIDAGEVSLTDAKALLEARDHPAIVEEVLATRPNDIEWAVRQALRRAEADQRRVALVEEHTARGVRVVADEGHRPEGYVVLTDLGVAEDAHVAEPCHAVVVSTGWDGPRATAVCTERRRHTRAGASEHKVVRAGRSDDAERARARERRQAAEARTEFLTGRLAQRVPKPASVTFVIAALVERANANEAGRAGRLLGLEAEQSTYGGEDWHAPLRALAARSDADGLRAAAAVAAAISEAQMAFSGGTGGPRGHYAEYLRSLGLAVGEAEQAHQARPEDDHPGAGQATDGEPADRGDPEPEPPGAPGAPHDAAEEQDEEHLRSGAPERSAPSVPPTSSAVVDT